MENKLLGRYGEQIAVDILRGKGYKILDCGYSCPFGEIDIIAEKDRCVIFVEVKTRKHRKEIPAMASVGPLKQRHIINTAGVWVSENDCRLQVRFDIIEVYAADKVIRHIKNAFA